MRAFVVGLVAALLATACQPPPRPFASDRPNPLLDAPESAGVVVEPITGLPDETAAELREVVIEALQNGRILASKGPGNRASLRLKADGTVAGPEGAAARGYIEWQLLDAEGRQLTTFESTSVLRPGTIAQDNARSLENIVRRVSQSLATSRVAARSAGREAPRPAIAVSVLPVEGAPGDGREALARALQLMLRNNGVKVAETVDADGLLVFGQATVTPVDLGRERVDLDWMVKWPDGREAGRVSQSNEIPAGLLRRRWGEIALAAADGAAVGIAALVRQIAAMDATQPPAAANWKPVASENSR